MGKLNILTQKEKEVLYMITQDFETIKRIALRRKTSQQAIYKIRKNLIKKGYLSSDGKQRLKNSDAITPTPPFNELFSSEAMVENGKIRLHGQEFNILILYKSPSYLKRNKNIFFIEENTVRLYENSIEIYLNKSFFGNTEDIVYSMSLKYLHRLLKIIEQRLKIILIKGENTSITQVKWEFGNVNDELAKKLKSKRIKIFSKKDGKLRFHIDNSLNLHEAELTHKETAKPDNKNYREFIDSLLDEPITVPEIVKKEEFFSVLDEFNKQALNPLKEEITLHRAVETKELVNAEESVKTQKQTQDVLNKINSAIENLNKTIQSQSKPLKHQSDTKPLEKEKKQERLTELERRYGKHKS